MCNYSQNLVLELGQLNRNYSAYIKYSVRESTGIIKSGCRRDHHRTFSSNMPEAMNDVGNVINQEQVWTLIDVMRDNTNLSSFRKLRTTAGGSSLSPAELILGCR